MGIGDLFDAAGSGIAGLLSQNTPDTPVLGGMGDVASGVGSFFNNIPRQTFLEGALDVASRGNYAVAAAADEAVHGGDVGDVLGAAGKGLIGEERMRFADVLRDAGYGEGKEMEVGPLKFNARDVAGFGLDVATDPLNYLSFGAGAAAKAAGMEAGKLGATTLKLPGVRAVTLTPFDPFTAVAHAADVATSILPGADTAKDAIRNMLGQAFVSNYGLKSAGYADVAEGLQRVRRAPGIITEEALDELTPRFAPLTKQQSDLFFQAADTGLDMANVSGGLAQTTGDVAVDELLRWYRGDYQPWLQGIKEGMGLESFQENYIRHVFPDMLKEPGIGAPIKNRLPGSFKERTGAEGFSTDPMLALTFDRAETLIRKETNDFLEATLERYGQKLKPDDILPEGFAEYYPKGKLSFYSADTVPGRIQSEIARSGSATIGAEDLKDVLAVGRGQRYAVPEAIGTALDTLGSPKQQLGLAKLFDTVQGLWKGSVTSIFPAFHLRNEMGNITQNWTAGVTDPRVYLDALNVQRLAKDMAPAEARAAGEVSKAAVDASGHLVAGGTEGATDLAEFVQQLKMNGVMGSGYYGEEIPSLVADMSAGAPLFGKEGKLNLFYQGRQAGQGFEDNAKIAHVLGRMQQGDDMAEAMASAKKHLFDYGDLSDFEREKMRALVPFYTWSRKNIPLQIEKLWTDPAQAGQIGKIRNLFTDDNLTPQEKALMPDYVLERFGTVIGRDKEGNVKVLNGLGLPIEDLNQLFALNPKNTIEGFLQKASPIFKAPLEYMFDYSSFTGRHITDPSYQNSYRTAYPMVKDIPGLRDWLGFTEKTVQTKDGERTYYNVDPQKMYLFTSLLGRFYYTAGKALDPRKDFADRVANDLSGAKITSVDLTKATSGDYGINQERVIDERNDALNQAAKQALAAQGPQNQQQALMSYRKVRTSAFDQSRIALDTLASQTIARNAGDDPAKVAALTSLLTDSNRAVQEYHAITPEQFNDAYGVPNMRAFYDARQRYLDSLPGEQRTAVEQQRLAYIDKLPPEAATLERRYQAAVEQYRTYTKLQPFALPVEQNTLDNMQSLNRMYEGSGTPLEKARFMTQLAPEQRLDLRRYQVLRTHPSQERLRFEGSHPELLAWGFIRSLPKAATPYAEAV